MNSPTQKLDWHQFKTLLRFSLKMDWRGASNPFTGYMIEKKSKIPGMAVVLGINFFASVIMVMMLVEVGDPFIGVVFAATLAMTIISLQVLLEFGNIIMTPDDYNIISPHPVNSKTFYVSKLGHLLSYVTLLSLTASLLPCIAGGVLYESILVPIEVVLVFWLCNVFACVAMMNLYTLVLKMIDRRRLEQLLGYTHMVLLFGLMLCFNTIPRLVKNLESGFDFSTLWWLKALPAYWIAAPVELLNKGWNSELVWWSVLGFGLMLGLGRFAVSYLSLSYAESLNRTSWTTEDSSGAKKPGIVSRLLFKGSSPEDRALMMLVRANFRHDTRFRMGVLAFLPLLLFYLVYGLAIAEGAAITDPLAPVLATGGDRVHGGMTNFLFGIVALGSPAWVIVAMQMSKEWRAAWVFFASPIDRVRMVNSMSRLTYRILLLPLGLVLCAILTYLYGNVLHAVMHSAAMVAVAMAGTALITTVSIRMPFALEYTSGNNTSSTLKPMLLSMVSFGIPIGIVSFAGYFGYLGWVIFVTAALLAWYLLTRGRNARIQKEVKTWQFMG